MSEQHIDTRIPATALLLGLAGLIPFVAGAAAQWRPIPLLDAEGGLKLVVIYGAIILSFLGGIEWGLALRDEHGTESTRVIALGLSTVSSLAAWAVLWLPSPTWQVGAALGLFVAVWGADEWMAGRGLLPTWFVDLRTAVSAIVAAILAVALWRL